MSVLSIALAACGGDDDSGDDDDDVPDAADGVTTGTYRQSVAHEITLPGTGGVSANSLACDLDGVPPVNDNALGTTLGLLASQGLDIQTPINMAIMNGDLLVGHETRADMINGDPTVSWQVYFLESAAAPVFDGTGTFTVASGSPQNAIVIGSTDASGVFTGSSGSASVPLSIPFTETVTINTELHGAQIIHAKITENGTEDESASVLGRLCGAITEEELNSNLIPRVADVMNETITGDCMCMPGETPMCGAGSSGETIVNLFGADAMDCELTADEVRNNSLVQQALAPDVDLFDASGAYNPGQDGEPDSLSLGIGFNSVKATFPGAGN